MSKINSTRNIVTSQSVEDDYYESYNRNVAGSDNYLLERERIMLENIKGENIMDIGCGPGKIGLLIKKKRLFGVDIFTNPKKLVKERGYKKVFLMNISQDSIPVGTNTMDTVICMETLEHLMDPIHALAEINRVLKKNGKLIISVPNIGWIFSRILHLLGVFADLHDYQIVPSHIRFFTISRLKKILGIMGFDNIKVFGTTDFVSPVPGQSILNMSAKIYPSLFASNPVFVATKKYPSKYISNSYQQVSGLSQGIKSIITYR